MSVLSLDGALRNTGWCFYDDRPVAVGLIKTSPEQSEPEALYHIFTEVDVLIRQYSPDLVAVEDQFTNKNPKTTKQLAAVRGAILTACGKNGVPVLILEPTRIKLAAAGSGKATKEEVREAVQNLTPDNLISYITTFRKTDDIWDAIAIAVVASGKERQ